MILLGIALAFSLTITYLQERSGAITHEQSARNILTAFAVFGAAMILVGIL